MKCYICSNVEVHAEVLVCPTCRKIHFPKEVIPKPRITAPIYMNPIFPYWKDEG